MNAPPGWYPQSDGQQRYWDGTQWTDHFAPGVALATPPVSARKNWFLRHKIFTGIGGLLLLGMVSGLANLGGTPSDPVATVAIEPAAASVETAAPQDIAPVDDAAAKAAADKAVADKAVADKAAADQAVADQAVADQAVADKVAADKVVAEKALLAKAAAAKAAAKRAATPQLGQTVRDGKFAFKVTTVTCGIAQVGTSEYLNKRAQGQYCRATLTVENIGNEAQTMFASNQYLFDTEGRKFSSDSAANFYDDQAKLMFEEINPGNSIKGFIYFDVPRGIKVGQLELHDSTFSGGIRVRL